ncbi:MAG TPA: malto-oligosyltrehalose synthase, partial [Candidatus Acidoferrales bacterium]|nr:malto-oligosyltrehalose synthase [Candidatus Acidoferrales bacterium]
MQIPRATYRLQFNEHFRLADALGLVPYLQELGISHVYASPLFKATPHSTHGYDVCDFNQLNPEVGTEADLKRLADELHARKMGLVLDIVPNHMGVASPENAWWWDVLAQGERSEFAKHFDIDWRPGKVLAPILGAEFETVLRRGELQLLWENGQPRLGYHEHRLPIARETAAELPADAEGLKRFNADFAKLSQLIERQHYELAFYERGDRQINYRRFFAVSSLAAVRVENEATFAAVHGLLRRWLETGLVDGLRVDHPDGLRDPAKYLERLRALAPKAWIVVEKILEGDESLPAGWPVQGTTGYDFLNQVNGLMVDAGAETALTNFYRSFSGVQSNYLPMLLEKKRAVLTTLLVAELNRLAGLLCALAAGDGVVKDFSRPQFQECLAEVIACFPVYRSYLSNASAPQAADIAAIKTSAHLACERRRDLPEEIFAFIHGLLLEPRRAVAAQEFVARFQQLTGAVMAKGAEDTAFYCYHRFTSLNEVGGNPGQFGVGLRAFHQFNQRQQKEWPQAQLTTSTHDTKRAEDVRARLNVLSEVPERWAQAVRRWSAMNARHRQGDFPDRNAEYLYYQTLVGAWPLPEERAQAYMEKASHEAKEHTDWTRRNPEYEAALKQFICGTLQDAGFTQDLGDFVGHIAEAAAVNSLAQTLIKLTAPGVPDIYQGCELWDLSLVDPDNRRPVDFARRQYFVEAVGV